MPPTHDCVLRSQVLAVLKNQHLTDPARQKEISELLGTVRQPRQLQRVLLTSVTAVACGGPWEVLSFCPMPAAASSASSASSRC